MSAPAAALFDAPGPRIFTIPPAANFLVAIADTLSDALKLEEDPSALAEATIFTPNRRAARALAEAFHAAAIARGHKALIAPEIRVLGDLEDDNTIAPIGVSELNLGPALPPARRRGVLANLVQAWRKQAHGDFLPPGSALAAADELSSLLDQAAMGEGTDWTKLAGAVEDSDLAAHWKVSARFLDIIASVWPAFLEEQGATDPMARRLAAAKALANQWRAAPPTHPVIIAGSTGATPATRALMQAAMDLPRGAVILPGLDPDVSDDSWSAIAQSPSHPQHTLRRALARLDVDKHKVDVWPGAIENAASQSRRKLINEALAPASTTKDWTARLIKLANDDSPRDLVEAGLEGLTLIEAEDESEEALAAALMLRETLESPHKTAALVTPDPSLARRVSALLKRWGVDVSPSSGRPFLQTPHGALFALLFQWLRDEGDPVLLLSLLKHPFVRLGRDDDAYLSAVTALEAHPYEFGQKDTVSVIRGPRRHENLDDLADTLGLQDRHDAAQLIRDLAAAARACDLRPGAVHLDGPAHAEACARLAESLVATDTQDGPERLWRGADGAESARFLETLADLSREITANTEPMAADLWPDFAEAVAREIKIPNRGGEHPRLAIWGPLEARLQTRDLIILGSLNEGMWPASAAADSFLPSRLRRELKLPDPEERLGLSAHDFSQLACAPNVVLLRAARVENKPSVASRWIWRLRTLASGGLGGLDEADRNLAPAPPNNPLLWARQLRLSGLPTPRNPPAPRPPVDARPTRFSVSRVAMLIRDPYAVYAQDILKLRPLAPVAETPGPSQRGTAIHKAVELYELGDAKDNLLSLITTELAKTGLTAPEITLSKPLWGRAAQAFLDWRASRRDKVADIKLEIEGELTFEISGRNYRLTATADRIERLKDGTLAIVDFKTGAPKTVKQVETGLEPQLPLEAVIAANGGFKKRPSADTSELIYVSLSPGASAAKANNGQPLKLSDSPMAEAAKAREGFIQLAQAYAHASQPYFSKPRAEFAWAVTDYDRLARRAEWASEEGSET